MKEFVILGIIILGAHPTHARAGGSASSSLRKSFYALECQQNKCSANNPVSESIDPQLSEEPFDATYNIDIPTPSHCTKKRNAVAEVRVSKTSAKDFSLTAHLKYGDVVLTSTNLVTPSKLLVLRRTELDKNSSFFLKLLDKNGRGFVADSCDLELANFDGNNHIHVPQFTLKGTFYENL